jgi:hypothetical protein
VIRRRRVEQWIRAIERGGDWEATCEDVLSILREVLRRRRRAGGDEQRDLRQALSGAQRSADVWYAEATAARRTVTDLRIERDAERRNRPTHAQVDVWQLDALSCVAEIDDPALQDHYADLVGRAADWLHAAARRE